MKYGVKDATQYIFLQLILSLNCLEMVKRLMSMKTRIEPCKGLATGLRPNPQTWDYSKFVDNPADKGAENYTFFESAKPLSTDGRTMKTLSHPSCVEMSCDCSISHKAPIAATPCCPSLAARAPSRCNAVLCTLIERLIFSYGI